MRKLVCGEDDVLMQQLSVAVSSVLVSSLHYCDFFFLYLDA